MVARSEAPADPRPYVRISVDLPTNPKLYAIDDPAAGWAYVVALCYSAQSLTDGHFPIRGVLRMANVDKAAADALIEQGLWHGAGHECDRCDQPKEGHAVIHDYLQHQRSAGEVRELTDKRREAGRRGAQTRWGKSGGKPKKPTDPAPDKDPNMASAMASAMANANHLPWQNDGNAIADERRGEEITLPTEGVADDNALFSSQTQPRTPKPRQPSTDKPVNAGHVLKAFIDAGRRAGIEDPTTGIRNRVGRDAKRLLTEDKVDPEKVMRAAELCGANGWTSLDTQIRQMDTEHLRQGRMSGGMQPNPRILRNSHENQDRYDIKL